MVTPVKNKTILKIAPTNTLVCYGHVLDLAEAVAAVRIAAQSQTHPLQLPAEAVVHLIEAHQALLAAHREIEKIVTSK